MFLIKKPLNRRTFLRGMGATVALPLLDAMIPARALFASMRPPQRVAFVYFPHGAVMTEWATAEGRRQTADGQVRFGRILKPLSSFSDRMTVLGGIENQRAYGPVHAITPGTWLSLGDATADQIAADYIGEETPIPSLSLAAEAPRKVSAGIWQGQFDENLATTLSFRSGRIAVPMQSDPRAAFDEIFVCSPQSSVPGPQSSVLDRVAPDTDRVRARLGAPDRAILSDYLESIRSVERRIQKLEEPAQIDLAFRTGDLELSTDCGPRTEDCGQQERAFVERLSLIFDLTALAFRADITRVASLMMAAETSAMTYSHIGVPESFHLVSHHQNDPENLEKLVRIQTFHTKMFANFVRTLAELPDGDASILDRTTILYGSNMSDSNAHDHYPLPIAVLGLQSSVLGSQSSVTSARPALSELNGKRVEGTDRTPMSTVLQAGLRSAGIAASAI